MRLSRCVPLALVMAASGISTACDRPAAADPTGQTEYEQVGSRRLLSACAVAPSVKASAVIGAAGGSVSAGGVTFTVPAGAVAGPTEFRVHVPSSQYAEVNIQADGQEHYQFLAPVVVSMDYSRCTAVEPLAVWHIDPVTKALLENMGGVNDALNQRMIFSTMHLSGYAIAN